MGRQLTYKISDDTPIPDGNTQGEHTVKVEVIYPDGTSKEVEVTINIGAPMTEKYDATAAPVEKLYGQPTTLQDIIDAVKFSPEYEENIVAAITVADTSQLPDGNTPVEKMSK